MAGGLDELAGVYSADAAGDHDRFPVIVERSPYGYEKTLASLRRAIDGHNFRIIREQSLRDGFDMGAGRAGRETIVYFCNFSMVDKAIHIDSRVGQFLPCRITVVEHDGQVYLMSINPKRIAILFGNDKLSSVCAQIADLYKELISETVF